MILGALTRPGLVAALTAVTLVPSAPMGRPPPAQAPPIPEAGPSEGQWVVAPDGNEARYRVREQLAGISFPNDAVGATFAIGGGLVVDGAGGIVKDRSAFTIDLRELRSDQGRRDRYLAGRVLETERFPEAVFVPVSFRGFDGKLPASGPASFELHGEFTVRGATGPLIWRVTAWRDGGAIVGRAETAFPFEAFEIPIPRVARVLSVENEIRLELDFRLIRSEG